MYTFSLHTKIIFGTGTLNEIIKEVFPWGRRVLLITGKKAMRQAGIQVEIERLLSGAKLFLFDIEEAGY